MGLTLEDIRDIVGDEIYDLLKSEEKLDELKAYIESDQFSLTEDQMLNLFGEGDEDFDQAEGLIIEWVKAYSTAHLKGSCYPLYVLLHEADESLIREICGIPKNVSCTAATNDVIALTKAYISVAKPEILKQPRHIQRALGFLYKEGNFLLDCDAVDAILEIKNAPIELTYNALDAILEIKNALANAGIISFDEFSALTVLQQKFIFKYFSQEQSEAEKNLFTQNKDCILNLDEASFLKLIHVENKNPVSVENKNPVSAYLQRDKTCLAKIFALDYSKILVLLESASIFLDFIKNEAITMDNLFSLKLEELTFLADEGCTSHYSEEAKVIFARFNPQQNASSSFAP